MFLMKNFQIFLRNYCLNQNMFSNPVLIYDSDIWNSELDSVFCFEFCFFYLDFGFFDERFDIMFKIAKKKLF